MAIKKNHSIEEKIEDWCKQQLACAKYYTKTSANAGSPS